MGLGKSPDFDKGVDDEEICAVSCFIRRFASGRYRVCANPPNTQPQGTQPEATKPYGADTKPGTTTTRPAMDDASFSLATLDTNKDGAVDKQEARASANLSAIFDKADTNKDGKLDAAELSAAGFNGKTPVTVRPR